MGGKTSTSTSSTGIPQEVLDRYNAVNTQAQAVASTPFQQYSQDASAFVAPLTSTQTAGIQNTNQMAGAAQPFYGAATGLTLAGAGPANAGQIGEQQIGQYMSPYLNSVVGTTMANLRQQQQQEQSGELGNQISRGAFGGDRGRIAQANLARQQNLATGQTVSGLMNQGYGQALQTAQQQQGVNLAAEQANLARLMQGGQQIAGLGAGAQAAGLQGAQAQLAAGTAEQQTNQAGQTALYNQFLQQQGYPFQVAQFLANIAMGTGALSGQTTTTQQPSSFFSDKRLKEDIEPIGETYDGQKIVKFRYKGESGKQIGLIAQDVEKRHPEAVGLAGGYKTVDYDKATKHAADKGHYLHGGLVPQSEGGAVYEDRAGQGYAKGGETSVDMAEILALLSPQKTRTPYGKIGLYGQSSKAAGPYGSSLGLEDPRGLAVRPVRELSLDEPGYVKKPAFAYGGLAPDGYASGGLPYNQAEGEYVPEDISDMKQTPAKLDSPKSVPGKSGSDFQTAMDMAKIAAMFMQDGGVAYASGGLVPHMADGGSPDFASLLAMQQAMYGNMPGAKGAAGGLNIPQQMQRKPEMLRPSPMASAPTESGFKQLTGAAESGAKFGENAEKFYNAGEKAYKYLTKPEEVDISHRLAALEDRPANLATGGLVPRHGYALDGEVEGEEVFGPPAPEGGLVPAPMTTEIRLREKAEQNRRDAEARDAASNAERVNTANAMIQRAQDARTAAETGAEKKAERKEEISKYFQNIPIVQGVVNSLPSYAKQADVAGEVIKGLGRGAASVGSPIYDAAGRVINYTTGLNMPTAKQAFGIGSVPEEFGRAVQGVSQAYNKSPEGAAAGVAATTAPVLDPDKTVVPIASSTPRIVSPAAAAPATTAAAAPGLAGPEVPRRDGAPTGLALPPLTGEAIAPGLAGAGSTGFGGQERNVDAATVPGNVGLSPTQDLGGSPPATTQAGSEPVDTTTPEKEKPGLLSRVGDTLTSRDFLVPLLSGLGSMASSPSRYLGSAVLQGLAGGAEASEALRKRSADIEKVESESDMLQAGITQGAIIKNANGTYSVRVYDPAIRNFKLVPVPSRAAAIQTYNVTRPRPGSDQTPSASGQPTPVDTQAEANSRKALTAGLSQGTVDTLGANAARIQNVGFTDKDASDAAETVKGIADAGSAARSARNQLNNLGTTLTGATSSQTEANVYDTVFKNLVNPALKVLKIAPLGAETIASNEDVRKITAALSDIKNQGGGNPSVENLLNTLRQFPAETTSEAGKAKLMATALVENQRRINEADYMNKIKNIYQTPVEEGGYGLNAAQVAVAMRDVQSEFYKQQENVLAEDRKILEQVYQTPTTNPKETLYQHLVKKGGKLDDAVLSRLEKSFTDGGYSPGSAKRLLGYFGG